MTYKTILLLALLGCSTAFAQNTSVNNHGNGQMPNQPPANSQGYDSHDQQIGTYSYQTNNSSGTIVTTGTKHPDLPNNSQQPPIQPDVFVQPTVNSGTVPGPTPRPTPLR